MHNIPHDAELSDLQKLHEHGKSALGYTRTEAQRSVCLLSEVNYWMRKFASIVDAHTDLLAKHSELLLKHDIMVSRNLGDGRTLLDNFILKEELASLQLLVPSILVKSPQSNYT